MKKSKLFLLMLLSTLLVGFTACSKDDGDSGTDYATPIAGNYVGDLSTEQGGTEVPLASDVKISVTKNSNTKVTLSLSNATIMGIPFSLSCPSDVTYNSDEKVYETTGTTTWNTTPVEVDGMFDIEGNAYLYITVKMQSGDMVVYFDGSK